MSILFFCPSKLFLRGWLLNWELNCLKRQVSYLSHMSCISFFRETLCSTFLLFFLFCLVLFFSSSTATSVLYFFLDYSLYTCMHLFSARFLIVSTFFNSSLFPQLPTTPKASLFVLASEHQGSSSFACDLSVTINWTKLISGENHYRGGGLTRTVTITSARGGCIMGHERRINMTFWLRAHHNLLT